jgi:hypothetical protein
MINYKSLHNKIKNQNPPENNWDDTWNLKTEIMRITKKTLLIILMLSGFILANGQKQSSENKIKSLIVLEEKHDMLISKQYKESETYYERNGNIIEQVNYKNGKITKHFKYQYDSDNNKIKEEEYDPSGKLIESSEYIIENGLRTEKTVYDTNKKVKSKKVYQYTTF